MTSKPGLLFGAGMSLAGVPDFWPGGIRHGGDVSLICGFRMERGKAYSDTVAWAVTRGSAPGSGNCEALR